MKFQSSCAIIIVLCFFLYDANTEGILEFDHQTWLEAFTTCESYGNRLPGVLIDKLDITLKDGIKSSSVDTFWLGAKYERITNYTDQIYPLACCEILWKTNDPSIFTNCVDCALTFHHVCAKDHDGTAPFTTWPLASKNCSDKNDKLPNKANTFLLEQAKDATYKKFWIDVVMKLNLAPNASVEDDDMCLSYHNGQVLHKDCKIRSKTFCIPETIATDVANSSNHEEDTFPNGQDNVHGALIAGIAGAGVVLIICIVVIVLLRRSKKRRKANSNYKRPVNLDNSLKSSMEVHDAYDDINEEFPDKIRQASIQIDKLKKMSVTYAIPNKGDVHTKNRGDADGDITDKEERSITNIYSVVQNKPRTVPKLNNIKQNIAGNDEYDKVDFGVSIQPEMCGGDYDLANFNRKPNDDPIEDVYNTTNFAITNFDRDNHAGNLYDKANFHHEPQEGKLYDTTRGQTDKA